MMKAFMMELMYGVFFLGLLYILFVSISDFVFSKQSVKKRAWLLLTRLVLAPIWPLAALSMAGRKRLFTSMRGTN